MCDTRSPVSLSLLHILQQFEQLAAHTILTVAKYAVQTIKPTMIEQIPSTLQSSDCTFSTISDSSADSTFCSAEVPQDTISSLLDHYSDQLDLNCSLLEQNLQLSSQFHGLKGNLAVCESHNLRLGAENHQFAVTNSNLASEISVFKLRFHNSNSRLSQPSNNNGPCLSTRQLFTVSARTSRTPAAALHTVIFKSSRLCRLKTFGMGTTRAFRHRREPAIKVESGLRHAGPPGLWIKGPHTTSRFKTIFGITGGVWNAPT